MPILLEREAVDLAIDERPAPRNGGRPGIELGAERN
jgi:hypothetical protein